MGCINRSFSKSIFYLLLLSFAQVVFAQSDKPKIDIHMIYMGGNDCPPCVRWRREEFPKLKETEAFKSIKFTHVNKMISSPVPADIFLPDDVKPYKAKLDYASSGMNGSAQTAIMVNGEVFDYYFGWRSAQDIEKMILAIQTKSPYPFEACNHRVANWQCKRNWGAS